MHTAGLLACCAGRGLHSLLKQLHGVLHPHGVHLPQDSIQAQSVQGQAYLGLDGALALQVALLPAYACHIKDGDLMQCWA